MATPSEVWATPVSDDTGPDLAEVVGANLRRLRLRRGLSLERLARVSGVSRAMLGQVELGKSVPSITVVWKAARALRVPVAALITTETRANGRVLRRDDCKHLTSADGSSVSRALFPSDEPRRVELYELTLSPNGMERAEPHRAGTLQNLVVETGSLLLTVGGEEFRMERGDAIRFHADVPHAYRNQGDGDCRLYRVLTYSEEIV